MGDVLINPKFWGNHGWNFLIPVAYGYPDKPSLTDKSQYKQFFVLVGKVLPCYTCSQNYEKHLKTIPLTDYVFQSRDNLLDWIFKLKNLVNGTNESEHEYLERVLDTKEDNSSKTGLIGVVAIIVILLIVFNKNIRRLF